MIVSSLKCLIIHFNIQGLIVLLFTSILNMDADSFSGNVPYLHQSEKTAGSANTWHALRTIPKDL